MGRKKEPKHLGDFEIEDHIEESDEEDSAKIFKDTHNQEINMEDIHLSEN